MALNKLDKDWLETTMDNKNLNLKDELKTWFAQEMKGYVQKNGNNGNGRLPNILKNKDTYFIITAISLVIITVLNWLGVSPVGP